MISASEIAFATALDLFEVENGHYPKGKNGLNDLMVAPRDAQKSRAEFFRPGPGRIGLASMISRPAPIV